MHQPDTVVMLCSVMFRPSSFATIKGAVPSSIPAPCPAAPPAGPLPRSGPEGALPHLPPPAPAAGPPLSAGPARSPAGRRAVDRGRGRGGGAARGRRLGDGAAQLKATSFLSSLGPVLSAGLGPGQGCCGEVGAVLPAVLSARLGPGQGNCGEAGAVLSAVLSARPGPGQGFLLWGSVGPRLGSVWRSTLLRGELGRPAVGGDRWGPGWYLWPGFGKNHCFFVLSLSFFVLMHFVFIFWDLPGGCPWQHLNQRLGLDRCTTSLSLSCFLALDFVHVSFDS